MRRAVLKTQSTALFSLYTISPRQQDGTGQRWTIGHVPRVIQRHTESDTVVPMGRVVC